MKRANSLTAGMTLELTEAAPDGATPPRFLASTPLREGNTTVEGLVSDTGSCRKDALTLALDAVQVAIAFTCKLRPVPDEETRIARELVRGLRNDLNDELLGDDLSPGGQALIEGIRFIQFSNDAAGIRGIRRLQCLEGTVLGFLNVGTDFVLIGCHFRCFSFLTLTTCSF